MTTSPDIFLSYNREDQTTARRVAEAFQREGFTVWWDATLRSGEAYDEVTENALRAAKAVVVLWSKKSVVSRWVRAEATLADRNKTLVPAMIEPCDRPIMFELTQTADLSHWQGSANDPAWLAFIADVARFVERTAPPGHDGPTATTSTTASVAPESAAITSATAASAALRSAVAPAPAWASPTTRASTSERGDVPSLAVLPFTNRSGLPDDDAFTTGIVEDIIDALSRGVYVRVTASAATAQFRAGAMPDLKAMSRELGVRYFLEGNVRRAGASMRVTSQLVDALTGTILWTQRFERPLTELATLQEQLVLEVAAHLNAQVHHMEMERALKKTEDLTAWEAVMRAVAPIRTISVAKMAVFVEEARKAVAMAPDYGLAHAVLATASALHGFFATAPDDPAEIRRIRSHVDRALALDPNNALVLAFVSLALTYGGDPEEGLRRGERAVELNPGAARAHLSCGEACIFLNRPEEALAHLEADIEASPGAPDNSANFCFQAFVHILAGRWSEAIAPLDRAIALNPAQPGALICKAAIYQRGGRVVEARELLKRLRQVEPNAELAVWEMCFKRLFSRSPVKEELLRLIRSLWAEAQTESSP